MAETYLGRACKRCGCEEKYRSNSGCVECTKNDTLRAIYKKKGKRLDYLKLYEYRKRMEGLKEAKENGLLYPPERQEAKENGKRHYIGRPCNKCGHKRRYVKTDKCTNCEIVKANEYRKRKVQKQEAA